MAKKIFLSHIDLALNELLQARLENLSGDPAGSLGRIYYNTVTGKIRKYTSQPTLGWKDLIDINDASASSVETYSSTKIESMVAAINNTITGGLVNKGGYNAVTNTPLLDTTPIAGIKNGWAYVVTVGDSFFDQVVEAGDMIIANQDSPTLVSHWTIVNKNVVVATESVMGILRFATAAEVTTGIVSGTVAEAAVRPHHLKAQFDLKAPLASPTFTGTVTLPTGTVAVTQTTGNSSTSIATTAFVNNEIANDAILSATFLAANDFIIGTGAGTYIKKTLAEIKVILGIVAASETVSGIIELATQAEVDAGSDTVRAVTPATLKGTLGITGALSVPRKYTQILSTSALTYAIAHGLGTPNLSISIRGAVAPFAEIETEVIIANTTPWGVTLNFNSLPTANDLVVTIIG